MKKIRNTIRVSNSLDPDQARRSVRRRQNSPVADKELNQGCILAGISFLSISSILLPTRKSGIRRDKYLSAAIFKEAVHSDDS